MSDKRDFYEILGLPKTASDKEIKSTYRRLAKKYHPDTNKNNPQAERIFKEITEAYNVLSNPEKRKLYDEFGHMGLESGFDPEAARQFRNQAHYNQAHYTRGWSNMSNDNYGDSFRGADDIFGDIFDQFFRGSKGRTGSTSHHFSGQDFSSQNFSGQNFSGQNFSGWVSSGQQSPFHQPSPEPNASADLTITFDEAATGADKTLHLTDEHGQSRTLQVHIPAGIEEGQSLRVKLNGQTIHLKIHIRGKKNWERKGNDIYVTFRIPYTTAVFGGEVTVPTLTGHALCQITPGTQSGSKIRLKGKGIHSETTPAHKGNEYVIIQIDVPKTLSPEAAGHLRSYQKMICPGRS